MNVSKDQSAAVIANPAKTAFTLIELMVVVAVMAVIAGMLMPALARSKMDGKAMVCLNNKRQLTLAWRMYADDNNGNLTPNVGIGKMDSTFIPNWVHGQMGYRTSFDSTNLSLELTGLIGPYVKMDATLFKCPADKSVASPGGVTYPRVRSISMGVTVGNSKATTGQTGVAKMTDVTNPAPSMFMIFLDENPDTIDDGEFYENQSDNQWIDYPGYYHENSGCISFADGHAELHRWVDSTTTPPISGTGRPVQVVVPNTGDRLWLVSRRMYP